MSDVIIIGNGPAGISASLYLTRAGINTTILAKDGGALAKTSEIENYYGFPEPITGPYLLENGIAQAKRLGATLLMEEVVGLGYDDKLTVATTQATHKADAVIIATGASRTKPKVKGLNDYEGKGVSYCAVCDAFFYRGKEVAVLGAGEYALHEAMELLPVASSVTMLANGAEPTVELPPEIKLVRGVVAELAGEGTLQQVILEDGTKLPVSGLFIALGVAGSAALARKLGAMVENNHIVVDDAMATNIPGLYAAGDCTGGLLQIAKAVYEGAKAGTEVVKYLRTQAK